jgi:hypothetical protein
VASRFRRGAWLALLRGAVFTWGQTMRLPVTPSWPGGPTLDAAGNMTWATFAQYFYGYVAARY